MTMRGSVSTDTSRPDLNIADLSISGLSSGADFVSQMLVAYADKFVGGGIFAGQPYRCAVTYFSGETTESPNDQVPYCDGCPPNKTVTYDHCKNNPSIVDVSVLKSKYEQLAAGGGVGDVNAISKLRVYMYRGTKDRTYKSGVVEKTRDFFAQLIPVTQLELKNDVAGGHAYPVEDYWAYACGNSGIADSTVGDDFPVQNCGYDGPGAALKHIHGSLQERAGDTDWGQLLWFDQSPFYTSDPESVGFDKRGLIYIPKSCGSGQKCNMHVNLHGCDFGDNLIFEGLVKGMSFNRWAEKNNMVVLYPKLRAHGTSKQHKAACWHVYGQDGTGYTEKTAPQMAALMNMIQEIQKGNLPETEGTDNWVLIGILAGIGCLVCCLGTCVAVFCLCCRKKKTAPGE